MKGNDLEKRIFGVTSGKANNAGLLPPLLKGLGMTLEALLAIPELEVCSIAITPPCVAGKSTLYCLRLIFKFSYSAIQCHCSNKSCAR